MPYRRPQSGTFPCCSHLGTHLLSFLLEKVGGLRDGDMDWVGAFLYTEWPQREPHSGAFSVSPELDCLKLKCPFPKGWPWNFQDFSNSHHTIGACLIQILGHRPSKLTSWLLCPVTLLVCSHLVRMAGVFGK